ncbi:MAG TPA: methionyl-tRNA formyltransferase [Chloroflexota bacterium]|jgi:methionyl-tRNA formyltransferase|nr:methionyl-tRNA formyltransferase [Chloroflexota bacterium]
MKRDKGGETRVVFMGSGPFAVPALEQLAAVHQLVAVVTQPDRPAGRGRQVQRGLVAASADRLGLPVLQPHSFKDSEAVDALRETQPQLLVVASYGKILPRRVLDIPERGAINLHPSLLPRHRGASPVAWTILSGESVAGVTLMEMSAKMDAGPIIAQREVPLSGDETTESLTAILSVENAALLMDSLPGFIEGTLVSVPQDEAAATYTNMLTKEMGWIEWTKPASQLEREVRAFQPWPVAHTILGGAIRVFAAVVDDASGESPAGTVITLGNEGISIQTGEGLLVISQVQPAGRNRMAAADYARGHPEIAGTRAGE